MNKWLNLTRFCETNTMSKRFPDQIYAIYILKVERDLAS